MYMVKRVLKNKRLVRSILILAGLVIVGFFLWTTLFKNTKIFEGQTTSTPINMINAAVVECSKEIPPNEPIFGCLSTKLDIRGDKITESTNNCSSQHSVESNEYADCVLNELVVLWGATQQARM